MKPILKIIVDHLKSPMFWKHLPKNTGVFLKTFGVTSVLFTSFFILLLITFISEIYRQMEKIPLVGIPFKTFSPLWNKTLGKYIVRIVSYLDKVRTFEVSRTYLISLAFKNLKVRKSRTLVTIAGMSFGIGVIVLLLSLGYGIERLVISRVATLSQLKVIDVSTGGSTAVRLNREALEKIKKFAKIEEIVPVVSLVGRVSINKATTDVLVYSTTNEYFPLINNQLIQGSYFKNNSLSLGALSGVVAGAETSLENAFEGDQVSLNTLEFNIIPEQAATVWDRCTTDAQFLGYTSRVEGGFKGQEYWGDSYYPYEGDGRAGYDEKQRIVLGKWVQAVVPLFDKSFDDTLRPTFDETGVQKWVNGCIQKRFIQVNNEYMIREVLGESTSASSSATTNSDVASDSGELMFEATVVGTDSAGIELVDLQSQEKTKKKETTALEFNRKPSGEAIVSTGLLSLLGVPHSKALNTRFKASLIVGKSQMPDLAGKALSEEVEYHVIGVVEDTNHFFYVPFSDVQSLGVTNFSQAKIVLSDPNDMPKVRKIIEDLGFRTTSTADTVAQIELLFNNVRLILGLLGMVALGVASLGMFNTLTVSLLERTREIGGMKTIGMVTDEVQDLFLSEAMIMGLSGGIGGLILGFLTGQLLSFAISMFSVTQGGGYLTVTYIPPFLTVFIIICSFIVGVVTGLYPAKRAKKISALNALRYE